MSEIALAVLFAVFIWWFSTGLVLLLDRLPHGALRWGHWLSSLLAIAAFVALAHTARAATVANAYCAFTCALLVWGWHELSFLSGWITGPRKTRLSPGAQGWPRFAESVRAILWHELGILAVGVAIVAVTWGQPNPVGTLTFLVLWVMRTSAKLNLFLGVRNLSEEFLPPRLSYLQSYFRRRPMNPLLPFSVLGSGVALLLLVQRAADPAAAPAEVVGMTLVGTMLAMAIVEHLMLVLPVPTTALWRWALRHQAQRPVGSAPAALPAAPATRAGPP
jgi:putative photosynthetic complex assembly protein 2